MLPLWLCFGLYGCLGWLAEIAWTALTVGELDKHSRGHSYLWTFQIYGLLALFNDPMHVLVEPLSFSLRATLYGMGFLLIDYFAGAALDVVLGDVPWDATAPRLRDNEVQAGIRRHNH